MVKLVEKLVEKDKFEDRKRDNISFRGKSSVSRKGRVARSKPVVVIRKCRCDV